MLIIQIILYLNTNRYFEKLKTPYYIYNLSKFLIISCQKKVVVQSSFNPTPITIEVPDNFPPIEHPFDNPLTQQGVNLGRHLFWDKIKWR